MTPFDEATHSDPNTAFGPQKQWPQLRINVKFVSMVPITSQNWLPLNAKAKLCARKKNYCRLITYSTSQNH